MELCDCDPLAAQRKPVGLVREPGTVSVIIPTYNRGHVLDRAISSVKEQCTPVLEVIVIDDGSNDDTPLRFGNRQDIRYVRQENAGVSASRNLGIRLAKGEWVAFLDSDDSWLPSKIEMQLAAMRDNPERRICHTEEIWIRNGKRVNQKKKHRKGGGDQFERCVELCCISPSSVLLHYSLFDEFGVFDESLPACEDYDLWLRLCAFESVVFVDTPQIYKYGGHADQLSRHYAAMDRFRVYALDKLMREQSLSAPQQSVVIDSIKQRLSVLLAGAKKRNNGALQEELTPYCERWSLPK